MADFVGFGLGASSTVGDRRWENTKSMKRYLSVFQEQNRKRYDSSASERVKESAVKLSVMEQMEEFMFLGLRMMEGVSKREFADSFRQEMDEIYGEALQKWIQMGMMAKNGDAVMLTDAGIDVSNTILTDFV